MTAILGAFDDGSWGMWFHRVVQKTIEEYRVNPITVTDIIVGKIISGFTSGFLKGLSVGVCLLSAYRVSVQSFVPSWPLLFIFLGCIMFSCLGSLAGTLIDKPENLGRLEAVVVMPFIFLAGLFFPPFHLPGQRPALHQGPSRHSPLRRSPGGPSHRQDRAPLPGRASGFRSHFLLCRTIL